MVEGRYRDLYQACVQNLLRRERGFLPVVSLAALLERMSVESTRNTALACKVPRVPDDPGEAFRRAVIAQEFLMRYVADVSKATGAVQSGAVKHLFRIREKFAFDPVRTTGSGRSLLWDAARAMLSYELMADMSEGLSRIQADAEGGRIRVLRVKERFSEPTPSGWSDVLINICFTDNFFPCEIQLVHAKMMLVRHDLGGHESYAQYRVAAEIVALSDVASDCGRLSL